MSTQRVRPERGWIDPKSLPRGPNGRALCRYCKVVEVPKRRRTFCSDVCVHEHRLRSDPSYVRQQVWRRDKGKCSNCGLNTSWLKGRLNRRKKWERIYCSRRRKPTLWSPSWKRSFDKFQQTRRARLLKRLQLDWILTRKSLWDADHILPVKNGGGECGLDNIQTLCAFCHREKTHGRVPGADLRRKRR